MDERQAKIVAGGVGLAAATTFALLSFRSERGDKPRLRIVEQTLATAQSPFPGLPPGIYFRTDPPVEALMSRNTDGPMLEVRDETGRIFPVARLTTSRGVGYGWVPFGYAKAPANPTIVRKEGGKVVERVEMRPFPPPASVPLKATPNAPIRIFRIGAQVRVESNRPVPEGEQWSLVVTSTPHVSKTGGEFSGSTLTLSSGERGGPFILPYPEDTKIVRIEITTRHKSEHSELMRIPGLRLVQRKGETIVQILKPATIRSSLGTQIAVRSQAEQIRPSSKDHRIPSLPVELAEVPFQENRYRRFSLELVSPNPAELNVDRLTIGGASLVSSKPATASPVSTPFTATLRLKLIEDRVVSKRGYVVPILPDAQARSTQPSGSTRG